MLKEITIYNETLELWPQKAIHWKKYNVLLLADLHLGKINHFRKAGIPVPSKANDRNIELLIELIQATRPARVICLGDLFHSHYNPEWEVFGELVRHFQNVSFELVLGNHDIMSKIQYSRKGIVLHEVLKLGPFILTHHPMTDVELECYNIAGHVHPGVNLRGKGKQSVTLPCFYFGECSGLLPAFGMFTGLAKIWPKKGDKVFIIVEENIIEMSPSHCDSTVDK